MQVEWKSPLNHEWRINVDHSQFAPNGELWMHIQAGPASVGTFITREQAVSIANAFMAAAEISAVEAA